MKNADAKAKRNGRSAWRCRRHQRAEDGRQRTEFRRSTGIPAGTVYEPDAEAAESRKAFGEQQKEDPGDDQHDADGGGERQSADRGSDITVRPAEARNERHLS